MASSSRDERYTLDQDPPGGGGKARRRRGLTALSGSDSPTAPKLEEDTTLSPDGEEVPQDNPEYTDPGTQKVEEALQDTAYIEFYWKRLTSKYNALLPLGSDFITLLRQMLPRVIVAEQAGSPMGAPSGMPLNSPLAQAPPAAGLMGLTGMEGQAMTPPPMGPPAM